MRRTRRALVSGSTVAFVLWVTATAVSATPTSTAEAACLARTSKVTVTGNQTVRWPGDGLSVPNGSAVDARQATFTTTPTANQYPVVIKDGPGGRSNLCMVGGLITSTWDYTTTPWSTWHDTTASQVRTAGFQSVRLTATNVGDGISFTDPITTGWQVTGARLTKVHDDCVEDDTMAAGTVDDSYLECWTAFSARGYNSNGANGTGNTFAVKNSLVWVKQMPTSYGNTDHPYRGPAIGSLFKWSTTSVVEGISPAISLNNVTIRVDEAPQWYGNVNLPPKYKDAGGVTRDWGITCTNVKVLWTGSGAYPGTITAACPVTLITGAAAVTEWNNAKAAYDSAHP